MKGRGEDVPWRLLQHGPVQKGNVSVPLHPLSIGPVWDYYNYLGREWVDKCTGDVEEGKYKPKEIWVTLTPDPGEGSMLKMKSERVVGKEECLSGFLCWGDEV